MPGEATLSVKARAFLGPGLVVHLLGRRARDLGIAAVARDRGAVVGHDDLGAFGNQ